MSDPGRRRDSLQLFLLSCCALFFELAMIRYTPAAIRVVGYFTNLVLLSTFLGLGAGTILGDRLRQPIRWFAPMAMLTAVAALLLGLLDTGNPDGQFIWQGGPVDAALHGTETTYAGLQRAASGVGPLPAELVIFIMMALLAGMFVPVGAAIGQRFARLVPLRAYAWDIGGSIAGILLFTLMSALGTTPIVWFAVAFGLLFPIVLATEPRGRQALYVALAIGTVAVSWVLSAAYEWSPYQKIAVTPVTLEMMGETSSDVIGYELKVNNDYHQMALSLGEQADGHPSLEAWRKLYDAPYVDAAGGAAPAEDVLILGAGTGNDVMAALRSGAKRVTAVDIDPLILDLGHRLHPERPYDDPRVEVHNDDARAFFKQAPARSYDRVVFGFLDSHTLLSSMSSVRIDTFVYTVDSFREAHRLVRPGGRIVLTFAATERWIAERLYRLFDATFGKPPDIRRFDYTNGVVFSAEVEDHAIDVARGDAIAIEHELPTDDWPYFYLQHQEIPPAYLLFIFLAILLGLIPMGLVPRAERTLNFQFFFLGAGFMLIETRSVTEMALLFGSTWIVNAVTFGGILAMVFLANLVCIRWKRFPVPAAYLAVGACVAIHAAVPTATLLEADPGLRLVLAILVLFSPIFFAGMAFSSSFRSIEKPHVSFGSNLLGAMVGGGLEYAAMVFGFGLLDGLAVGLYGLAFLSHVRSRR